MPVFNRQAQGADAIRSVLEQTFDGFEVVVVDDASSPPFALPEDLARDERVRLVRRSGNGGPAAARNTGAQVARGAWLAWLDSDDVWHREKLERQLAFVERIADGDVQVALATGFTYLRPGGEKDRRLPMPADRVEQFSSGCWFCPGSTVMVGRKLFMAVGPYDESLRRLEDLDWFVRMALQGGRLEVLEDDLVTIAWGVNAPLAKVDRAAAHILRKFAPGVGDGECDTRPEAAAMGRRARRNLAAYLFLEKGASAINREKNYLAGAWYLARSFLLRPRRRLHLENFWRR